jgi:hypothetical protein
MGTRICGYSAPDTYTFREDGNGLVEVVPERISVSFPRSSECNPSWVDMLFGDTVFDTVIGNGVMIKLSFWSTDEAK